jgi:uncharacterized membrane protein YphA (DoxX/SURF4 family)
MDDPSPTCRGPSAGGVWFFPSHRDVAASIPFPEINFYLAPVVMVLSGLSMGTGFYARVGALAGALAMLVAAYSKLVIEEWPGPMEIPMALPLVVLAACVTILIKGPGAWSADLTACGSNK